MPERPPNPNGLIISAYVVLTPDTSELTWFLPDVSPSPEDSARAHADGAGGLIFKMPIEADYRPES